jgi:hypothetical protein
MSLASVFTASSIAILGLSAGPYVKGSISISVENSFIVIAAGFWLAAFFYSLSAVICDNAHCNNGDENAIKGSALGLIFHSISAEIMFLIVTALAVCISIATYRYGEKNLSGLLYPAATFTASLLFGFLVVPMLKPCSIECNSSAKFILRCSVGIIVFIAGTGLSAYYLAVHALLDIQAFYCFGVGLLAAIIIATLNGISSRNNSIFKKELAVIEILMALGATVLSFRWMTGYGAALCSVGFLASLPIIIQTDSFWGRKTQDISLPVRDAVKYMEPIIAIGSYMLLIALLRLFTEKMNISSAGINIAEPYSLIGLTIGGIFPLMMGSLLIISPTGARQFDISKLQSFGRQTAFRILGIFILTILIPLLIAVFWRVKAAGGFIAGLAVSELFLIVQFRLREAAGKSDDERYSARVNHLISIGSALILTLFAPSLIDFTGDLTRSDKIIGLCVLMGTLLIIFAITIGRKMYAIRHSS